MCNGLQNGLCDRYLFVIINFVCENIRGQPLTLDILQFIRLRPPIKLCPGMVPLVISGSVLTILSFAIAIAIIRFVRPHLWGLFLNELVSSEMPVTSRPSPWDFGVRP